MNKPIESRIFVDAQPEYTDFSTYDKNPEGPYYFEKVTTGPQKGFYRKIPPTIQQGKPLYYTKAYFPKPIKYLYRDFVPYFDNFYYIPKTFHNDIPVRKLIYGLQNYDMPTSGNIEEYLNKFNDIRIPPTFCPVIDPCEYEWCDQCKSNENIEIDKISIGLMNIIYLMLTIFVTLAIILTALFY